jgi:hypothetical protein
MEIIPTGAESFIDLRDKLEDLAKFHEDMAATDLRLAAAHSNTLDGLVMKLRAETRADRHQGFARDLRALLEGE